MEANERAGWMNGASTETERWMDARGATARIHVQAGSRWFVFMEGARLQLIGLWMMGWGEWKVTYLGSTYLS